MSTSTTAFFVSQAMNLLVKDKLFGGNSTKTFSPVPVFLRSSEEIWELQSLKTWIASSSFLVILWVYFLWFFEVGRYFLGSGEPYLTKRVKGGHASMKLEKQRYVRFVPAILR